MNTLQTVIIAVVEGITEFLPVSSTGHMIVTQRIIGVESTDFVKMFTVCIQFGAILSVVILYWKRFFQSFDFYLKLFAAFLPAAVFGLIFKKYIDIMLGSTFIVAVSLILGGIVLVFSDRWFNAESVSQEVTYPRAVKIGLFQVISMIPGVSRSAATIIGGLSQGLSRRNATEFSFFLAVPTMFAASVFKLAGTYKQINAGNIKTLLIGSAVAFIVASLSIKGFIMYLAEHSFRVFGYYRIIIGSLIIALILLKVIQ